LLDEIFVGEVESAQRLAELLDRPVHLLPLATDAVEFSDRWATRCSEIQGGVASPIDVLNIGRRDPALHQALLRWSRADERYYVFDTMVGARVIDHRVHRRALADQLQRTSAAISSYAKYGETGMEELRWVPARVFDNLASGTLLVGAPPHPASQRLLFGREVVHPLPEDPVEGAEVVAALSASPALLEREENMRIAMRGHDWSHRWISLLETCGHRPARTLLERRDRLRREAAEEGAARSDG
jgi:hypothetical protein